MKIRPANPLIVLCALALPVVAPASDEGIDDDQSKRCINARAIRRTEVINDEVVIFHMQGRKIFLNNLTRTCKGLSRDKRFSFVTHTRSLCALDRINVLKESGSGFYEGRACKLGRFRPATEDDIADIYEQQHKIPEAQPVELPPVQDVTGDDTEGD